MRTTITLEDDVYKAAKALAAASGKRLGEVLSELARRGLKAGSKAAARKTGLPVFHVSPGAQVIPSSRASEMLADDLA